MNSIAAVQSKDIGRNPIHPHVVYQSTFNLEELHQLRKRSKVCRRRLHCCKCNEIIYIVPTIISKVNLVHHIQTSLIYDLRLWLSWDQWCIKGSSRSWQRVKVTSTKFLFSVVFICWWNLSPCFSLGSSKFSGKQFEWLSK